MKNITSATIPFCLASLLCLLFHTGIASALTAGQIDVNTATLQQLRELPYIGDKRARAIIAYREKNGPFSSIDQLAAVTDIGDKSVEAIKPYLTLHTTTSQNIRSQSSKTDVFHITQTHPGDIVVLQDRKYLNELLTHIKTAQHSIYITMFLFKTTASPGNKADKILKELIKARKKGVEVVVILEKSNYDQSLNKENKKVGRKLRDNNIRVYYDSPHTTTHAKFVVIDGRYTFIGSHNLTHSALALNHEVSLLIDNRDLAAQLTDYMSKLH